MTGIIQEQDHIQPEMAAAEPESIRRIGIMGGSFDPVHAGHVNLARDALQQTELDQVLLIPARLQPFKQDRRPASGRDRMEMLRLALANDPKISPCDYELWQEGVSYTYLTLRAMQERFGASARLYFIIGTDSLLKLETWMHAEELLHRYAYIVGSRPGYREEEMQACMQDLRNRYGTEILPIHNRRFDISATEIRRRLAAGEDVKDLVPPVVEDYIRVHNLYRVPDTGEDAPPADRARTDQPLQMSGEAARPRKAMDLSDLNRQGLDYIRRALKPSRYDHTLRVREEAIRLAERFGADSARAETAAIFHDMAKNLPREEMNALIRSFGLADKYLDNPNLAHSKLGAALMERDFGITDRELLAAVSSHTTGRAGMGLLEKVVFLADAIEPGRSYPSVGEIRRLAETDLDGACIRMLERTIAYLKKKGAVIDTDTLEALADLQKHYNNNSEKEGR